MRWMVLILGLLLSGCYAHYQTRYQGPPPLQTTTLAQVNTMVGAQQPVPYKVGFMEGCDSGHLSAGDRSFLFKKDAARFDTDAAYKQGWTDGFNRCASGGGVATSSYYYQGYYGYDYYYPYYSGTFSTGFYSPSYFYTPGYSLWLGYYGYPRHTHYVHRHNYYYTPWSGGHKHRRGGKYYSGRGGHKRYSGGSYLRKPYRGGYGKSYKGRSGGHGKSYKRKGSGHKSRSGNRRGGKGGGSWIR